MLRARAHLRLGNPDAALSALQGQQGFEIRDRGQLALLRAVSYSRLREVHRSREAFLDAHAYSISSTDPALEAEVEFYEGLTAFGEVSLDEARAACHRGLEIASTPRIFPTCLGNIPLAHVISRTQELLGLIDAADGRYRDSLVHARSALATLDSCEIPDVFQEAFALKNLAILARDFDIEEDARRLAARVSSFAWTQDMLRVEFTLVESLGWCSALRGDIVEALRLFRRASSSASIDPERVLVGVNRALLAREFGHRPMAVEEIEYALNLADKYDWSAAPGDHRLILLDLAQAAAPIAPVRARETINRYTAIRNSMDSTFAARIEARVRAEEAYTHGVVLRAEGRLAASMGRLQSAFETWRGIGYEWRAGRAALELAELGAGEVFRLAVHRELHRRPDSIFSARARLVA